MKSALVIGNGGRESAICSRLVKEGVEVYAYPGNPGIFRNCLKTNIVKYDFTQIRHFIENRKIALTVIGPEAYLADGLTDYLLSAGHKVFGPEKAAARIESDKSYAKKLMKMYEVPTASFDICNTKKECLQTKEKYTYPYVVKVAGLAAGKGVLIINDENDAANAVADIYDTGKFGNAGSRVVIEQFMKGIEASLFVITDGKKAVPLLPAQDYKRAFDDDEGPNTGGMGSYAPSVIMNENLIDKTMDTVIMPVLSALRSDDSMFRGLLYAGLMIDNEDIRVVEFNARFGDPETQSILPLMRSSLYEMMMQSAMGHMSDLKAEFSHRSATTVIMAADGYPGQYPKGMNIHIEYDKIDGSTEIFHAGTSIEGGNLVSSGGRILGVTSTDETLEKSSKRVYNNLEHIRIANTFYRRDIGRIEERADV